MSRLVGAFTYVFVVLLSSAAMATTVPLNIDNNGNILVDNSQIVDVNFTSNGSGGWLVSVGTGLNFEEFYANFNQPVGVGDISITTAGWSLVTAGGGGGTAGNFGKFSVKIDGPVSGGTADLQFELTLAGLFDPNSKGNTFAAKISSQQGGNAGGFVSNASVSAVPLPAAAWLLLSAMTGLIVISQFSKRSARERRRTLRSPVTAL
jgi:hypothetical protein